MSESQQKQSQGSQAQGKPKDSPALKTSKTKACSHLCAAVPTNVPSPDEAQAVLHPRKDVFVLKVKIRIPKSTYKTPKLTPSQLKLQQQCTCDEDGSMCSDTCGFPDEFDGAPGNRLNFQVPDDITEAYTNRTALNSELVYCKKEGHDPLCNVCNVTPKDAPKGIRAQKVLYSDKDVFLLKIGKQTDEPNRTGNIEVELVTPRAPAKPRPTTHFCRQIQCDEDDIPCCAPCRVCRPGVPKKRGRRPARCCP